MNPQSPSQKIRLLRQYRLAGDLGLTDEEAAERAGLLRACYWRRCTDLRQGGYIFVTTATRKGEAGVPRTVCSITDEGVALLAGRKS